MKQHPGSAYSTWLVIETHDPVFDFNICTFAANINKHTHTLYIYIILFIGMYSIFIHTFDKMSKTLIHQKKYMYVCMYVM